MPFKSQAQKGFLYENHPDIAKRFQAETPKGAKLPGHVGGKSKGPSHSIHTNQSRRDGAKKSRMK